MGELIRSKGFCEHCGNQYERLEWAHVIPRTNKTLRWDILNALSLDSRCHRFFWHENPLEATRWFQEKFPERYKYLMWAKNQIVNRTDEDYAELLKNIHEKNLRKLVIDKNE